MVYIDVIYSEALFCDAWWQTTQVTQVHQVQPIGKEVILQKPQHVLLCFPLPVWFFHLFISNRRIRQALYSHYKQQKKLYFY